MNKHHPGPGKWDAAWLLFPQRYILGDSDPDPWWETPGWTALVNSQPDPQ